MNLIESPPTNVQTPPARTVPAPALGWALVGREEEELVLQVLRSKSLFRYYGPDPKSPPPMVATLEREAAASLRHADGRE